MGYNTRSSRVLLSSIPTLTFYADEDTSFRRTEPVQQLTCQGKACQVYQPPVVQCQNMGGSGAELVWACSADLPSSMRFGRVQVSCEGYDSPDDPYVLKGSCGLTYNLVPANPNLEKGGNDGYPSSRGLNSVGDFTSRFVSNLLTTLTLSIFAYIVYTNVLLPLYRLVSRNAGSLPTNPTHNNDNNGGPPPPRPWFGGFGGGAGGDHNRPRRPGAPPPPPYPGTTPTDDDPFSSFDRTKTAYEAQRHESAWRPGFWTGLAAGGAGLLAADRMRGNNRQQTPLSRTNGIGGGLGGGWGTRGASSPPSFGGVGARSTAREWDRGEGTSGTSGSFRTSTGFGGTRNR